MNTLSHQLLTALHWLIDIIEKHEISYQVSGGFAAHLYGAQRPINDIDIDIPGNQFDIIYHEVQPYLTYGPAHYQDAKWKLPLMTLDFHGQEIDISDGVSQQIYHDKLQQWLPFPVDFSRAQTLILVDRPIQVIHPADLIRYKSLLHGKHQQTDIQAVQKYLNLSLNH